MAAFLKTHSTKILLLVSGLGLVVAGVILRDYTIGMLGAVLVAFGGGQLIRYWAVPKLTER